MMFTDSPRFTHLLHSQITFPKLVSHNFPLEKIQHIYPKRLSLYLFDDLPSLLASLHLYLPCQKEVRS